MSAAPQYASQPKGLRGGAAAASTPESSTELDGLSAEVSKGLADRDPNARESISLQRDPRLIWFSLEKVGIGRKGKSTLVHQEFTRG